MRLEARELALDAEDWERWSEGVHGDRAVFSRLGTHSQAPTARTSDVSPTRQLASWLLQ